MLTPRVPARVRGPLALVLAAALFGTTFALVQDAIADLTPMAFLAARFWIGAAASLAGAGLTRRRVLAPAEGRAAAAADATGAAAEVAVSVPAHRLRTIGLLPAGALCGIVLFAGYALQTVGLETTTTSNSAFITGLLVGFTPLIAAVVSRRLPAPITVLGVVVAVAGLALLTGGGQDLNRGDLLTLGCAISFAAHIVMLDVLVTRFRVPVLNTVQLATVALCATLLVPVSGVGTMTARAAAAVVFTGLFVSAGAFWLQLAGQRTVPPTRAALLLLLEPVFAAVIGYAIGERLGIGGFVGAALILAGTATAELGSLRRNRRVSARGPGGGSGGSAPRPGRRAPAPGAPARRSRPRP